ncbi:eukaryotic translation initiation factor 4E transporter [Anastrepha obliqua]|uniref:eukaryotic translation initiation factor 4E transporter n=1 Tax=Anastrepha obliqua TaxID=95512 RepID=UPI00240A1D63|nr:eukaryotic translation initiation factor 4E transporter [Anastrepha obliqua]XP_054746811.1 eukaryotic translation initiation factor 4E transporter [Anastrepha obliqua]
MEMSSSPTPPLDTAINRHVPFKSYNYPLADSKFSNTTVSICDTIKRYSRSQLFDLRNDSHSRRRPEPNLQADLQSLGIWKFNASGSVHQNGVNASSEGASVSANLCGGSHSVQISSTYLNVRSQRSPSRREINTAVNITNSSYQHNLSHHSLHKTYIDHRSISSSHLMPAFAKRRIAASSTTSSNATGMVPQNLPGSGNSSFGPNSPVGIRSQTPTDGKDGILYSNISGGSNGNMRQRTKEQLYNYRQGGSTTGHIVGEDHNLFLCPQRNVLDHDRDREQELQSNNGRLSSPVTQGSSRHSHNSVGIAHERRIGSGRLLPRDVNWDYRTVQDRDKILNLNSVSISEKDALPLTHLGQARSGGRYSDRTHDRTAGGNGYTERRPFDRRGGGCDDNSRDKYEHVNSTLSPNVHSSITRRDMYGSELSTNQHTASHNRNRRNHQYNEKNEEPEWFSGGPTSQHDTIELRGFEETDDHYNGNISGNNKRPTLSASSRKITESSSSRASSTLSTSKEQLHESLDQDKAVNRSLNISPNSLKPSNNFEHGDSLNKEEGKNNFKRNGDSNNNHNNSEKNIKNKLTIDVVIPDFLEEKNAATPNSSSNVRVNTKDSEFNFDAFLNPNLDPLKHSLMRGDNPNGDENEVMGSSRFSRWFVKKNGSSGTQSLSGGNNGNNITLGLLEDKSEAKNETNTLMEFLNKLPTLPDPQKVPTITSVEELEARMRSMNTGTGMSSNTPTTGSEIPKKKDQDLAQEIGLPNATEPFNCGQPQAGEIEAFKKLLEQLGSGSKQQHTHPQQHLPPSNLQMNVLIPPQNRTVPVPPLNVMQLGTMMSDAHLTHQGLIKNDELKKVMHLQSLNQHHQNNGDINNVSQSQLQYLSSLFANQPQKLLEARHIYQCITRGEIPIHFLEQEMNNPNASPHAKEVIAATLRETSAGSILNCNVSQSQALTNSMPGHQQNHSPIPLCHNGPPMPNQTPTNTSSDSLQQQQLLQQIPNSNAILPGQTDLISLLPLTQASNLQTTPNQRDLQFHTQTIMQNAMLKKKIEEQQQQQKDSLRRRQEIQKQPQANILSVLNEIDMQQVPISNSMQQQPAVTQQQPHIPHTLQHQHQQSRHINSPTPLAFTPTSVLRKMTAEKDNPNTNTTTHSATNDVIQQQNKSLTQTTFINSQNTHQHMQHQPITTQPRMILGGNHSQQQLQISTNNQVPPQSLAQISQQIPMQSSRNTLAPMKWPLHLVNQNMSAIKPMGRPILKGPLPPQPSSQQHQPQQMQQISQLMFTKLDFQQMQQRLKNNQTTQHMLSQSTPQFPPHTIASPQPPSHSNLLTHVQQQQQMYHQQQRALALQRHQQQQLHLQQQLLKQQQNTVDTSNHNICMPSSLASDSNAVSNNAAATAVNIINYRDGTLSPTSNQLAQWFSPELLAQASAGKLPLLNMNQALSLEEFEKNIQHSSTTVHN